MDATASVVELEELSWYDYVCAIFTQDLKVEKSTRNLIKKIVFITFATIVISLALGATGYGCYCKLTNIELLFLFCKLKLK